MKKLETIIILFMSISLLACKEDEKEASVKIENSVIEPNRYDNQDWGIMNSVKPCQFKNSVDFSLLPERWVIHHDIRSNDFQAAESQGEVIELKWTDLSNNENYIDFLTLYRPFFVPNDKNDVFIDLDSYTLNLEKKKGKLISGGVEVDSQVQLVTSDYSVMELMFVGPSVTIEDAVWIAENECWILTLEEYNGFLYPTVVMFDINQSCQKIFRSKSETEKSRTDYNYTYRWNEVDFLD